MLKEILSISGKPGLYKLVSYGKNMLIVESLTTKKRVPALASDKIVSLGDISIYTTGDDVPLGEVFQKVYEYKEHKTFAKEEYSTDAQLVAFFEAVLPEYDRDRVYKTDIKKVITWYNTLVEAGVTDFVAKADEAPQAEESPAAE